MTSLKQYLGLNAFDQNEKGEKMSHEEKYTKIVNAIGLEACIRYLPATKEEIIEALKTDEHLNNIPLRKWDSKHAGFKHQFLRIGINTISLSDTVCTLKRASKMYAEQ